MRKTPADRAPSAVRGGVVAASLVLSLGMTGCTQPAPSGGAQSSAPASPTASPASPSPSPEDSRSPAASEGGACKRLDYDKVESTIGVSFDVAVAGKEGKTRSCVLQVTGHEFPDLTLTTSPTKAGPKVFRDTVAPSGGKEVSGLGEAAYRVVRGGKAGAGPTAQVGWLTGDWIVMLRHTYEPEVSKAQARQKTPRLVKLARQIQKQM